MDVEQEKRSDVSTVRLYVEKSKKGLNVEEYKSVYRVAILNSLIDSLETNGNSAGREKEKGLDCLLSPSQGSRQGGTITRKVKC